MEKFPAREILVEVAGIEPASLSNVLQYLHA